jgi:F-type H+-transporting ATPase subunit c
MRAKSSRACVDVSRARIHLVLVDPFSRRTCAANIGGTSAASKQVSNDAPTRRIEMKKVKMISWAVLGLMLSAITAVAQPAQEAAEAGGPGRRGYIAMAAGIGFAIAVFGGAIGQSRIGAAACEGAARNPGAAGRIQTMMILGLALIESLVLFALLIVFTVVRGA